MIKFVYFEVGYKTVEMFVYKYIAPMKKNIVI